MKYYPRDKLKQFTDPGAGWKIVALAIVLAATLAVYWLLSAR